MKTTNSWVKMKLHDAYLKGKISEDLAKEWIELVDRYCPRHNLFTMPGELDDFNDSYTETLRRIFEECYQTVLKAHAEKNGLFYHPRLMRISDEDMAGFRADALNLYVKKVSAVDFGNKVTLAEIAEDDITSGLVRMIEKQDPSALSRLSEEAKEYVGIKEEQACEVE